MAENINDGGAATDHLLPEVREAVEYCAEVFDASDNGEWATVRAELERQAAEIAELRKSLETANAYASRFEKAYNTALGQAIKNGQDARAAEVERDELRALLDDPGTTHSEGCWNHGKRHYMCARRRIEALTAELAALRVEL